MHVPCVGAIIVDERGRLLLVRRANPPAAGQWSLPGGRIEPGETPSQAVAREVREETGLIVDVGRLVGSVQRPGPDGRVYAIADYECTPVGGVLAAGDDATDARWVDLVELDAMDLTDGLLSTLRQWRVTP
jgi:mutator protein MutT